ncbi:hypothetical protein Fleli_0725 [Bernardetia litoralis DSM 6794]|uniref:Uncharacterized protein n=1 Tax=Bernardetia litoralis (strain ATCC 23117 / DSM 6794 / NBRC 15988 / NCIMB 1366 / Fx l1 / Sio-4) TaxID=880071 RepID=I4AGV0_BERLS|nr:hypothetical protein [Bernardetia litoralis]AFM03185.1 hypothetical protein Fleli_0725 [Bernardetia litoralis DSM 6794]
MKHLIFILKTAGASLLISSLLGLLVGWIWSMNSVSHPHQASPNWLITLILAAGTSLLAGIIIGSTLSALKKTNLVHSTLYTVGFVAVVLGFFLFPLM